MSQGDIYVLYSNRGRSRVNICYYPRMRETLLHYRDSRLPFEARVLLWQWARHVGLGTPMTESLRTLCRRLRMTLAKGMRGMAQLKDNGLVSGVRAPQPRGRPRTTYYVTHVTQRQLRASAITTGQQALLDRLISTVASSGDGLRTGEQRRTTLTLANAWLLAVLLAHMDRAGQVTTLSYGDLVALTGMSRNRLQSQVKKLITMGVIHHQPGPPKAVLGTRPCSIFTLQLAHDVIQNAPRKRAGIVFLSTKSRAQAREDCHVVNGMVDAACVLARMARQGHSLDAPTSPLGLRTSRPASLAQRREQEAKALLDGITRWRGWTHLPDHPLLADWLLVYVHRYACWVLSQRSLSSRRVKAALYRQIRRDMPHAALHESKAVTLLAAQLAQQCCRWLKEARSPILQEEWTDLALTPVVLKGRTHWWLSGRVDAPDAREPRVDQAVTSEADDTPISGTTMMMLTSARSDIAGWLRDAPDTEPNHDQAVMMIRRE